MKKVLMIALLILIAFSYVFASDVGIIQWRYKIRKFIEEDITLGFTDLNGVTISSYELSMEKALNNAQIHLSVVTNKVNNYTLTLEFTPLLDETGTQLGFYKARVSDIITFEGSEADFRDVTLNSSSSSRVSFPGDTSDDASNMISVFYPISFDFSEYIESYDSGVYSGTITVEVATT